MPSCRYDAKVFRADVREKASRCLLLISRRDPLFIALRTSGEVVESPRELNRSRARPSAPEPARPRRSRPRWSTGLRPSLRRARRTARAAASRVGASAAESRNPATVKALPRRQTCDLLRVDLVLVPLRSLEAVPSPRPRPAGVGRRRRWRRCSGLPRRRPSLRTRCRCGPSSRSARRRSARGGTSPVRRGWIARAPGRPRRVATPGAIDAKIGPSRSTTSCSPPIIRQKPRSKPQTPPLVPTSTWWMPLSFSSAAWRMSSW